MSFSSDLLKLDLTDTKLFFESKSLDDLLEIRKIACDKYYNSGDIILTDLQYDLLEKIILSLDNTLESKKMIGYLPTHNKIKLPVFMGSLNKIYPSDTKDIQIWLNKNNSDNYIIEDKVDGVSCLLIYNNDSKINLYTRGNGIYGTDISHISNYIKGIPSLKNINIIVRGELVLFNEKFNNKYKDKYSNPRNMVSGLINSKIFNNAINDINFIAYEICYFSSIITNDIKPYDQLLKLKELGFNIVNYELVNKNITKDVNELICKYNIFKTTSNYNIDGIVIQSNECYNINTENNPSYSFAFKINDIDNIVTTYIKNIEWNVSKWNILKPTICINEVIINNVLIKRVTGHNAKYIKDKNLGPGACIQITRSGEVIPYIVNVISECKEGPQLPDTTIWDYSWNKTNVDLYLNNKSVEQEINLITNFFKDINIKFISHSTVTKMFNNGLNNLFKILYASKEDLIKIETFKEKTVERIYNNIRTGINNATIPEILSAFCVFGYGISLKKINLIFKNYPNFIEIDIDTITFEKDKIYNMLIILDGFSDKTIDKIISNFYTAKQFYNEIIIFKNNLTLNNKKEEIKEEVLYKIKDDIDISKVVFSGFRDKNLEKFIISKGGEVSTSISSKTSLIIIKDINSISSKIEKAKKKQIPIILYSDITK
jgi:NAD-dependent DNA ligase